MTFGLAFGEEYNGTQMTQIYMINTDKNSTNKKSYFS